VARTVVQLLGLPPLGVPRADDDPGLADLVSDAPATSPPPRFGQTIGLPAPQRRAPRPHRLPPPPGPPVPVPPVLLRDGSTLPPPNDVPLPQQPRPPGDG
jgi:hypothetical protein